MAGPLHQKLKEAREAKGLSLEDLSRDTRIRQEYLEALEEGDFRFLPRPYVRMFVKTYAQEVGLDPEEVLTEFDRAFPPELTSRSEEAPPEGKPFPWRYGIIVGAVAILGLVLLFGKRSPSPPPSIPKPPPAVQDTLARVKQVPKQDTVLVLSGRAREKTWVAVASDGKLSYVGFMPMDREVQWEARGYLELLLGKPHGVKFALNGRPVDDSPWSRKPVRIRCTRDGVEAIQGPFSWEEALSRPKGK
ncbi:MAG: hypothetical protein DRP95_06650 [Candidatus Latescibacterota bacterium]|nr:MAG: hypothetical protein DRP95_06650 [Candidatus Latescibacterota bacterium]